MAEAKASAKHTDDDGVERKSPGTSLRSSKLDDSGDEGRPYDSDEGDAETEREWRQLMEAKSAGSVAEGLDSSAQAIVRGFGIDGMNMRNADTGRVLWESGAWSREQLFHEELAAHVPASILQCRAVSREIVFTSAQSMEQFRIEQRIYFEGVVLEEWFFTFGFVIPGSTNSWQSSIEAAEESKMLPAHLLSGNVTIETAFFDGSLFIGRSLVRIFYDADEVEASTEAEAKSSDGGSGGGSKPAK